MSAVHVSGVGLRLPPDLTGVDDFWRALLGDRQLTHQVREDGEGRRTLLPPGSPGTSPHGLLAQIDSFDPAAFGISASEAEVMDPQQRLLLETVWDCLADAGHSWSGLRGQDVGVFVGAYSDDWLSTVSAAGVPTNAAVGAGLAQSVLANRVSYLLDLRGPSLTVDTACSSSLVAVHLALQALQAGDCDRALVAGVSLSHDPTIRALTRSSLPFSATERCRPFDAAADGIIRGEGCVVLLLEREDITRGGRHGRLLGSASTHGGRTNGLTAPSPGAQVTAMRRALDRAGLQADRVGYVEAHGTGTLLGDPIEARALNQVYGGPQGCVVGSVKARTGHLEAAAGVVGLLTALLVARHGIVPAQAGFEEENPATGLARHGLRVLQEPVPLADPAQRRITAVSSIGFGGSTAHVIVGSPDPNPSGGPANDPGTGYLLLTAAASEPALIAQREALRAAARSCSDAGLARLARRQSRVAPAGAHRLAWAARTPRELREAVLHTPGGITACRPPGSGALFVFSGQGATWPRMGEDLWRLPELARDIDQWENEVREAAGWSLAERLCAGDVDRDTESVQVSTAAVQFAVTKLLRARGIEPCGVVGHSMGDVTAAAVSGALTTRAAFAVLVARARALEGARGGAMTCLRTGPDVAEQLIEAAPQVSIAALNSPVSTVAAGSLSAIEELERLAAVEGVRTTRLPVGYAFHSPQLAQVTVDVEQPAIDPLLPWYSTVTAERMEHAPDADYWTRNVREPVALTRALARAITQCQPRTVIEVGPRPVLSEDLRRIVDDVAADAPSVVLDSMGRRRNPAEWLPNLVAGLFAAGTAASAADLTGGPPEPGPVLPPAYQRTRFWPDSLSSASVQPVTAPPQSTEPVTDLRELSRFICRQVAGAAEGFDGEAVPEDVPLSHWEVSSLAVVSMRNALERGFGILAPLPLLLQGHTPLVLANLLCGGTAAEPDPDERFVDALSRLDELSDDEVSELLAELQTEGRADELR